MTDFPNISFSIFNELCEQYSVLLTEENLKGEES